MSHEQSRTDVSSHERSPDHQYSLSIEQATERYAEAGLPRTIRAIQKYCALSKLDCHKVETETGEKYLVAPYSVTRHIAYIKEVRVASSHDKTRTDATVRPLEFKVETALPPPANEGERTRTVADIRAQEDRYISRLETDNDFLRGQMEMKDTQIKDLTERARETNHLIAGLQKMLTPLLGGATDPRE